MLARARALSQRDFSRSVIRSTYEIVSDAKRIRNLVRHRQQKPVTLSARDPTPLY